MLDSLSEHLTYLLDAEGGASLAERLYGPAWTGSVRSGDYGTWKARRLPPPLPAAAFLAEFLVDEIGHDGRSTRNGRGSGWWLRDPDSGEWQEADTDAVADAILPAVHEALREAQLRVEVGTEEARRIARRDDEGGLDEARSALRDARLSAEVLAALAALVASGSSGRWGGVSSALRSRLALNDEVLGGVVWEWLSEAAPVEGWTEGSRVTPATLWDAYEEGGGGLPRRKFLRALTAALGPPRKSGERVYTLPALDDGEPDDEDEAAV